MTPYFLLIASGNFTSAIGLLRLQYEAFTRSLWLFYAASDLAVSKLMTELTAESVRKSNKLPMLSEMLKNLEDKAPHNAFQWTRNSPSSFDPDNSHEIYEKLG